jgi:predicted phage terminase large subunit-like protein
MPPSDVLALAQHDFACYCIAIQPGFELARHIEVLVDALERVERGEIRRLCVSMPPRHGKSLACSVLLPSWYLGRHPDRSIITASYGAELSEGWGRRVRNILADPLHQAIFPNCRLSPDSQAMNRLDLTAGGSYFATGRGGPITGRGASLLVLDDTLKDAEEARSETIRASLLEWYKTTAYTRLTPDGAVVLVQTRWHEADLPGVLIKEQPGEWTVVNLPALAEPGDPLGRSEGEALWPSRFSLDTLQSIRAAIGGAAWNSLYQGRCSAAQGTIFKRDWFRTYREPPATFQRIIQSWDTGFKTGRENDFSVSTTWGTTENGYYLLSLWRDKVEFPELKRQVASQAEQWAPHAILVEDAASGQSLIQELKVATRFAVLPIKPDSDKVSRAQAVTPLFEAGKVFVPEGAVWLSDYLDELAAFPASAHDDCVDSTSMALNYLRSANITVEVPWQVTRRDEYEVSPALAEASRKVIDGEALLERDYDALLFPAELTQ